MEFDIIDKININDLRYLNFKSFSFENIEYDPSWEFLFENKEIKLLLNSIEIELNKLDPQKILPEIPDIFNCFKLTKFPPSVIICGQDPYINKGEAMGLAFSVREATKIPPSLRNIFNEIKESNYIPSSNEPYKIPTNGNLTRWAEQGVLLLNSALTVELGSSSSHKLIWKNFSDLVIELICNKHSSMVFMLWGDHAKQKKKFIKTGNCILESSHPSPLSVTKGFKGCDHFRKCNDYLKSHNMSEINW
jgi:uracil-DNA glycosylase